LSTLTKVLIVLLTISSIFLCGIVVTYVSNAQNYKQMHDKLRIQNQATEENEANAKKQLNAEIEKAGKKEQSLNESLNALKIQIDQLRNQLTEAKRTASQAVAQENAWKELSADFLTGNKDLQKLLDETLTKLANVEAKKIQGDKELKETTGVLIEKMAIIDDLDKNLKLLNEEKIELQNRLGQRLQAAGYAVPTPVTVTTVKDTARVATPAVDIGLEGLVTTVDLTNDLAEISIGSANGVKQNMKFHVTRADKFICNILILSVEPEKAVGTLELMDTTKESPKAGDIVSTNL